MSRFARALPWGLLALSLAAHAWTRTARPRPPGHESLPPQPGHAAGLPAAPLVTPSSTSSRDPAPAAPADAALPPAAPAPLPPLADQIAAFRTYATLAAATQATADQHDDLALVMARWIATDPVGAAGWIAGQPDADPRLDPALAQLSNHLVAQGRFDTARDWLAYIHTPEVRLLALEDLLAEQFRARRLDAAALHAAATRDGLPPDRVRAILDYSRLD